jgi:hypothetical protein
VVSKVRAAQSDVPSIQKRIITKAMTGYVTKTHQTLVEEISAGWNMEADAGAEIRSGLLQKQFLSTCRYASAGDGGYIVPGSIGSARANVNSPAGAKCAIARQSGLE